jgi:hypothetical protein
MCDAKYAQPNKSSSRRYSCKPLITAPPCVDLDLTQRLDSTSTEMNEMFHRPNNRVTPVHGKGIKGWDCTRVRVESH